MMKSFIIRVAGVNIQIIHQYRDVRKDFADYIIDADETDPDISISVSSHELFREMDGSIFSYLFLNRSAAESVCLYRKMCLQLGKYDAFLIHASAVEYNGQAYLFSGPSGIGKSTHASLWKQVYGEAVHIINDDLPVVRRMDDGWYVFGSPRTGKRRIGENRSCKLQAIAFLEQSMHNEMRTIDAGKSLTLLMQQVLRPKNTAEMDHLLQLISLFLTDIPQFMLYCRPDTEAVELARETMENA